MGQNRDRVLVMSVDEEEASWGRKSTRKTRSGGLKQETKEKFVKYRDDLVGMKTFNPSIWQKECLEKINAHDICFIDSHAGCGKSSIALYFACQQYLADVNKQIVFVRTPAEMGMDRIGFLPGAAKSDKDNKLGVHFESTKALLQDFIGKNKMDSDEDKRIHFMIPNFALGKTFTDTIYVLDEVQLLQPLILKLLLERIGEGTKCIVLGSSGQLYATEKGRNALRDAKDRFFDQEGKSKYKRIGSYTFPKEANQRHDVVRDVIEAYDED